LFGSKISKYAESDQYSGQDQYNGLGRQHDVWQREGESHGTE